MAALSLAVPSSSGVPLMTLDPLDRTATRRAWRVIMLTAAVALMSLVDLYITLLYVRTVGMGEGNPLARWIMLHFSADVVIWWKLLTVTLACVIFITARKSRIGELGVWVSCGLLLWLIIRWMTYSAEVTALTPVLHTLSDHDHAKWVQMPH
jgi:hypothetical protein